MPQWVQHKSGIGEKWELFSEPQNCHQSEWRVKAKTHSFYHDLPKSEYILCEPPEEWEDKTVDYKAYSGVKSITLYDNERLIYCDGLHNGPHFLVERRKV